MMKQCGINDLFNRSHFCRGLIVSLFFDLWGRWSVFLNLFPVLNPR